MNIASANVHFARLLDIGCFTVHGTWLLVELSAYLITKPDCAPLFFLKRHKLLLWLYSCKS